MPQMKSFEIGCKSAIPDFYCRFQERVEFGDCPWVE